MRIKGTLLLAFLAGASACGGNDDDRPTAAFTAECIDFLCEFDASASSSAISGALQYSWNFGDGIGAFGEITDHAYLEDGDFTVLLTVFDQRGNADRTSREVSVNTTPVSDYFRPIRQSVATSLFLLETFDSLIVTSDALQDAAEAEGVPDEDGYQLDCDSSGSSQVLEWDDGNSNLLVDNGETLNVNPTNCKPESDRLLNSGAAFDLVDDFDGAEFGILSPADVGFGINTEILELWSLRGNVDFVATRSAGNVTQLQANSPQANIIYRASGGGPSLIIPVSFNLNRDIPSLSGISGTMTLRYGQGASDKVMTVTTLSPISFDDSTGELLMTAGSFSIAYDNIEVTVSIDGDPDYLAIDVDTDNDGTIDVSGRLPQFLTLVRLAD